MAEQAAVAQQFTKNKIVRVRSDRLSSFNTSGEKKFKDRIGVVVTQLSGDGGVIVQFPQVGHRLAFSNKFIHPHVTLEFVTDIAEVQAWQTQVAETARRKTQRKKAA